MTVQNIVAALIVLGAVAYVASMTWKKVRAFSPKKSCGTSCGCEADNGDIVQ